jgi:hypothetical protein
MRILPLAVAVLLAGCGSPPLPEPSKPFAPEPLGELPGLHNVWRVTPKLLSGSSPEGDAGFLSLQSLGVQTILSVDGAKPDTKRATAFGMAYVHLPIGYDGISEERARQLAKAVRDLPGPVYIHCHHGKHRGPAAALTAVRGLDHRCGVDDALKAMEKIGTDPKYLGLYDAARTCQPIEPAVLDAMPLEFPSSAGTAPQVGLMVAIDEHFDRLKLIRKAGWTVPASHPDLVPAQEALMLREQYRELARVPDTKEYRGWVEESEANAGELEEAIRAKAERAKLDAALAKVQADCARCHKAHRDSK